MGIEVKQTNKEVIKPSVISKIQEVGIMAERQKQPEDKVHIIRKQINLDRVKKNEPLNDRFQ